MSAAADIPTPTPVLEMIDVAVPTGREPESPVFDVPRWSVKRGEYWVVGGVAGSGKSALLETTAALRRPVRGTHRVFGYDVTELGGDDLLQVRRRLGMVFAGGGRVFSELTVAENVALPLCYHRNCPASEACEESQPLLLATGLSDKAHLRPGRLTRDWRQRVALARALAHRPDALLLDNPLEGLEPRQLRWWLGFLARLGLGHEWLHGQPLTLVVTCEDLRPFLSYAQQFGVLGRRGFVAVGDRQELERCDEPELRQLLGEETRVE
jgi:ABC-type transporter Mla maintaining outer membrane lipid asymmetry ATPase subunit MlaF